ncbi:L-lactate dehydrogenase complex protein LldG [Arthrobacter sp. V4I6]|uniref:LutC/YkgG family protein n=1 Tax=unclassified Arthrobacter TaxID=235627 RepID=UPI002783C38C|nr:MULTISPECIES: lactate utilization protein C [unclassified Arthrobacter]MDQ0822086.1 L-lactate dehydrogenase complex protein LldG [Arthrobacter sp. V1I7]MDQ0856354.1 L-lactate dehydrogenase complex protein LldG [Arthrobacter sp. V4I6]
MSAREDILARIRAALQDSPEVPRIPREYRATSGLDEAALIELLVDRLIDYKAQVSVVDAAEVPARVAALLAGAHSYVVPAGLDAGWLAALGSQHEDEGRRHVDSAAAPLTVAELDGIDAVVTGSAVAVAETGTIILDGSPNQGRRAISLVPDHHICVVKATDITGILPEALRRIDGTRPLTMISGPSATSDIELERVEGVHGPRRLDVIIAR